jgi:hypothetical protein
MSSKKATPASFKFVLLGTMLCCLATQASAQIYSPVITKQGQVDATDLKSLARSIYVQANARTPREKAEAIWRFFLTDGRFVKPGFWYHIAGWAYEEPMGEVLDPMKLIHSYGFGLCYHVAPLLEAVWDAGGFEHARVWFLTGHSVAEVFYDGAYHYFDSDMMGYNSVGKGDPKVLPVASVHQIEQDGNIILGKLSGPKQADPKAVDNPWYPADVREDAIPGLAELFTTTNDNRLYAFTRYPQGHQMSFVLRPGEKMIRYYHPETPGLDYLPFKYDGVSWQEFPQEIKSYRIKTNDGPKSQKDGRSWATGKIEYRPPAAELSSGAKSGHEWTTVFRMPCPYVIIDASFSAHATLPSARDQLKVETSADDGRTWALASTLNGPYDGVWQSTPGVLAKGPHGKLTAVSGTYAYLVRYSIHAVDLSHAPKLSDVLLTTRFELNPRTLPDLIAGHNALQYRSGEEVRYEMPIRADTVGRFASQMKNAAYQGKGGQGYIQNQNGEAGEIVIPLAAPEGKDISTFDAGGRFLDLRDGLAPDKFTAEVRKVTPWPGTDAPPPNASIAWSTNENGPFQTVWSYDPNLKWKDRQAIDRTLRWPEVDRHITALPPGTHRVYIKYRIQGMALDDVRLAANSRLKPPSSSVRITHLWKQNGVEHNNTQSFDSAHGPQTYSVQIPEAAQISNEALIVECLGRKN